MMDRKFIHCDCDCFFAAIEIRDDPALAGLPVAVGGDADRRGVIATCNYEARKYGVHSAMASSTAKRLCPDLIIIPGTMEKYRIASQQIHRIFQDYTDLIEPLSLDEAYLDVTHSKACRGSATLIAEQIRFRVREEVRITLSAGIAPNKFLAKIASDWNKPDGQFVITPDQVADFVLTLPVKKLHGVGKVTARKMEALGIESCADLQAYNAPSLVEMFGSFGERLYSLCRGIDERPINTSSQRKSISVEHTFPEDLQDLDKCLASLPELMQKLLQRLGNHGNELEISKQFVKLKFHDFVSTTVEHGAHEVNMSGYRDLCCVAYERGNKPVRLVGLGVRLRDKPARLPQQQLSFPFLKQ